jgi:hypothetical protein
MGDIGWIIKGILGAALVILVFATIVALWPVWLALAIIGIPAFVFWKRSKRKANMV